MCTTEPSPTLAPSALIEPAPIPIPAFLLMYFTTLVAVALIESRLSPDSMRTQLENCLTGVRTPAIIGVGSEM